MNPFPFIGIKRPLTQKEQENISRKKAEEERKIREAKEKEEREEAAKEKRIQDEIDAFDRTLYGSLLSIIRTNMNNGKSLEELKKEFIPSNFKTSPSISYNANFPKLKIIKIPIRFGINQTTNRWVETEHIFIFDNSNKKWMNEITDGNVSCNNGNRVNLESPCIFFESQNFALGVNDKKEIYIVEKKNGKFKKAESIEKISGNETNIEKGFFYMIKSNASGTISPINSITIEELNKTTRSRVVEKMRMND